MSRVVATILGLGLGLWLGQPATPEHVVKPAEPWPAARAIPADLAPCIEELSALHLKRRLMEGGDVERERQIEDLEGRLKRAGLETEHGTIMSWPDAVLPEYGPAGFAATAAALKRACPDVVPANAREDCSEFPCRLTWIRDQPTDVRNYNLRQDCPFIDERRLEFHGNPAGLDEESGTHLMTLEMWPDDLRPMMKRWRGNRNRRSAVRLARIRTELVAEAFEQECTQERSAHACRMMAEAAHRDGDRPARIRWMSMACECGASGACDFIDQLDEAELPQ